MWLGEDCVCVCVCEREREFLSLGLAERLGSLVWNLLLILGNLFSVSLRISNKFLILDIVFFSTRISIWCFIRVLFFSWNCLLFPHYYYFFYIFVVLILKMSANLNLSISCGSVFMAVCFPDCGSHFPCPIISDSLRFYRDLGIQALWGSRPLSWAFQYGSCFPTWSLLSHVSVSGGGWWGRWQLEGGDY